MVRQVPRHVTAAQRTECGPCDAKISPVIPFNRPHLTGREVAYIEEAAAAAQLAGNGRFTKRCQAWLEERLGAPRALLTHSCTAALEMAALLIDVEPGDEVIMPSFTFVSTANAFVLRGASPVFVDIRPDTLNIDERQIEAAITRRTKAIVPSTTPASAARWTRSSAIAVATGWCHRRRRAGAAGHATTAGRSAAIGAPRAFSFHETKNVISGEGGALSSTIRDSSSAPRSSAKRARTASQFFRGQVDKYTWVDIGSSFLPGEITAAFLWAQLEDADAHHRARLAVWNRYDAAARPLAAVGVRAPIVPSACEHNAHLFYLLLPPPARQADVLKDLNARGVNAVFHYVPLHSSPAGQRYGRVGGPMDITEDYSRRIIRLPLWVGLPEEASQQVIDRVSDVLSAVTAR